MSYYQVIIDKTDKTGVNPAVLSPREFLQLPYEKLEINFIINSPARFGCYFPMGKSYFELDGSSRTWLDVDNFITIYRGTTIVFKGYIENVIVEGSLVYIEGLDVSRNILNIRLENNVSWIFNTTSKLIIGDNTTVGTLLYQSGITDNTIATGVNPVGNLVMDLRYMNALTALTKVCECDIDDDYLGSANTFKAIEWKMKYNAPGVADGITTSYKLGTVTNYTFIPGKNCSLLQRINQGAVATRDARIIGGRVGGVLLDQLQNWLAGGLNKDLTPLYMPFILSASFAQLMANRITYERQNGDIDYVIKLFNFDYNFTIGDTITVFDPVTGFNNTLRISKLTKLIDKIGNETVTCHSSKFVSHGDNIAIRETGGFDFNLMSSLLQNPGILPTETEVLSASRVFDLDDFNYIIIDGISSDPLIVNGGWNYNTALNHAVSNSYEYESHDVYFSVTVTFDGGGSGTYNQLIQVRLKNITDTTYYPSSDGVTILDYIAVGSPQVHRTQGMIHAPMNWKGKTIRLEVYVLSGCSVSELRINADYVDIRGHKHNI